MLQYLCNRNAISPRIRSVTLTVNVRSRLLEQSRLPHTSREHDYFFKPGHGTVAQKSHDSPVGSFTGRHDILQGESHDRGLYRVLPVEG